MSSLDWLGTGAKSARDFGEKIIAECIRRVKLEARNDPVFVPPADDLSTILAARYFVLPPVIPPPGPDDAGYVLADRIFNHAAANGSSSATVTADDASTVIAGKVFGYRPPASRPALYLLSPVIANGLTMLGSSTSATMAGRVAFSGNVSGAAFATGEIGRGATGGLTFNAATGATYDALVQTPGGAAALGLLTGTLNWQSFGTFTAVTFIGALTGNASSATKLQTARTINGVSFDGTANIVITAAAGSALTIGSGLSGGSYDGSAPITIALTSSTVTINGTSVSLGGSATVTAAAGTLTGATLNASVTGSSLTTVGTLSALTLGAGASPSLPSTGANPTAGTVTLVLGTATVNTTAVGATDLLFFQRVSTGGTIGFATTYTINPGTSFTVSSDSALDTSTYNWLLIRVH